MSLETVKIKKIKEAAKELERLFTKYEKIDKDAALLYSSLKPFLEQAKVEGFRELLNYKEIPGGRLIEESGLPKYVDLMNAYAEFKFLISDGKSPNTQAMLKPTIKIKKGE